MKSGDQQFEANRTVTRDNKTAPSSAAFELTLRRIEIHQLLNLLIECELIHSRDASTFFGKMAIITSELTITPEMKAASATAIRHYKHLASMVEAEAAARRSDVADMQ